MRVRRFCLGMCFVTVPVASAAPALANSDIVISTDIPVTIKDPTELGPLIEWEAAIAAHATLLIENATALVQAVLAEAWKVDEKGRTLSFTIKEGLKFSDGSPLSAEDVAFSLKRVVYLDKPKEQVLSRCLEGVLTSKPNVAWPNLRVLGRDVILRLKPGCGTTLLNELAQVNYGVVSPRSVGKDFKFIPGSAVSGMYAPKDSEAGSLLLVPNRWFKPWKPTQVASPTRNVRLKVINPAEPDLDAEVGKFDVIRTTNFKIFDSARRKKFSSMVSLPVATWYLASFAESPAGKVGERAVLADVSAQLAKDALPIFKEGQLEKSATRFFPDDMKCAGSSTQPTVTNAVPNRKLRLEVKTRIKDPSQERLVGEVRQRLAESGYTVVSGAAADIRLMVEKIHLGGDIRMIFQLLFATLKTIPDTEGRMRAHLSTWKSSPGEGESQERNKACDDFNLYHNVPVGHRHYAFLAKREEDLRLFGKDTGTLRLYMLNEGGK